MKFKKTIKVDKDKGVSKGIEDYIAMVTEGRDVIIEQDHPVFHDSDSSSDIEANITCTIDKATITAAQEYHDSTMMMNNTLRMDKEADVAKVDHEESDHSGYQLPIDDTSDNMNVNAGMQYALWIQMEGDDMYSDDDSDSVSVQSQSRST